MIVRLMGMVYATPAIPSGISIVSAASGPYAAELSATSPNTGTPVEDWISSLTSSSEESGRPNRKLRTDVFSGGVAVFSVIRKALPSFRSPVSVRLSDSEFYGAGRAVQNPD